MKPSVLVTRRLPDCGMDILEDHTVVTLRTPDAQIEKSQLIEKVRDAEGLVCLLSDPVDREVIEAGRHLKVISTYAVGYNNIDLEAAKERGIAVCNTPGVLTDATADIAFALLITAARRIAESDRWLRENEFAGWAPMLYLGLDLAGKTLGIIGAGRIGSALAKRAHHGFDMKILYHNRNRNTDLESAYGAKYASLQQLLEESDFVSLHLPLTDETHHLIGEEELGMMKSTAVLVNTARGPVIDEQALIKALKEQRIFAAGLDVYEEEPKIPAELKQLDNAVILPHIGSASFETRNKMAEIAAWNCINVLQGEEPLHRVV
ncbi:MAG: D-glycerate dehydrogenase [Ectothiorhodospiraceae bacterium]|nr:D-glycerate dehydrogenase [Ectothiorhodospiraceae bacterium]